MDKKYVCPMHPEETSDKPGRCKKCGMKLVEKGKVTKMSMSHEEQSTQSYAPLAIIAALILVSSLAASYPWFNLSDVIKNFMTGFFLVFSGFKLVDLKGFAQGYSTYDLLAQRWYSYGYIYPFIELAFGILMILGMYEKQVLLIEIAVMAFSGLGVLIKVMKKERFQCVCLGTFLKVPLTYVTLVEDFGMVALAVILLLLL